MEILKYLKTLKPQNTWVLLPSIISYFPPRIQLARTVSKSKMSKQCLFIHLWQPTPSILYITSRTRAEIPTQQTPHEAAVWTSEPPCCVLRLCVCVYFSNPMWTSCSSTSWESGRNRLLVGIKCELRLFPWIPVVHSCCVNMRGERDVDRRRTTVSAWVSCPAVYNFISCTSLFF